MDKDSVKGETNASGPGARTSAVRVLNELGLHARPAARLAQEARKFSSNIRLVTGNQAVDAKSILDILSLAAARGTGLEIHAEGVDAHQAVEHLEEFFKSRLGEGR